MKQTLRIGLWVALLAFTLQAAHGQEVEPTETEGTMETEYLYKGAAAPPAMPAAPDEASQAAPTTRKGQPAPYYAPPQGPARGQTRGTPGHRAPQRHPAQRPAHTPYPGSNGYGGYDPGSGYGYDPYGYDGYAAAGLVFVPGHYVFRPRLGTYVWVSAQYLRPPHPGMVFVLGHWRHARGQWFWVQSHWRYPSYGRGW